MPDRRASGSPLTIAAPSGSTGRPLDPAGTRDRLASALLANGPVRVVERVAGSPLDAAAWRDLADDSSAILVIRSDDDRSPGWEPPGPIVRNRAGRAVPVGLLWGGQIAAAAAAADTLADRSATGPSGAGPVALLGPGRGRARDVFDAVEASWARSTRVAAPIRWTAERLGWEELRAGLGAGLGAALYLGHGTPDAWPAYGGLTPERLRDAVRAPGGEPMGAMLALTCNGAGRDVHAERGSFAGRLVSEVVAGSVLAAVGLVDHAVDRHLAHATLAAIAGGARTMGDVLVAAASDPRLADRLGPYRILGDPRTSIVGPAAAWDRARTVRAAGPSDPVAPATGRWPSSIGI
ncbi:MAG TPA: hypothetical protein VH440_00335 [Candidatus Limnocylindrales bacterium]